MAKNKGLGGKKHRKSKGTANIPRELVFKTDGQVYAQVIGLLGGGFLKIKVFNENGSIDESRAHIRGKLRKRVWIKIGDVILVTIRDYQEGIYDIILKYNDDEARSLRSYHEIPANTELNENTHGEDDVVTFGESDYSSDEEEHCQQIGGKKVMFEKNMIKVPEQSRRFDLPEEPIDIDDI